MFERTIQVKIAIIPGTRPEIIKMSPVIRECEGGLESFTQHTGRQISLRKDRAGAEGYSAQDGDRNDAGTFESLLRVGMIVINTGRRKKEPQMNTDSL